MCRTLLLSCLNSPCPGPSVELRDPRQGWMGGEGRTDLGGGFRDQTLLPAQVGMMGKGMACGTLVPRPGYL